MTPYDGTSDPSYHLRNFRSRMYLIEASDAIRYSPSRRIKPNALQACWELNKEIRKAFTATWKDSTTHALTYKVFQQKRPSWDSSMA
ncbi:hypothetical protein AHAS_Ahas05G0161000 [Arachis hypogaea]